MKKTIFTFILAIAGTLALQAELKPGDTAPGFSLKNVDASMITLSDYGDEEGIILIFTCNPCPYAKAYEQRIIGLHGKYADQGFPVVAINPNDDEVSKEDTFEKMKALATEKSYPFPYLKDESQEVYKAYGATRTPHIFLLERSGKQFKVAYIGAIDDSAMDASAVEETYLEDAIASLKAGNSPDPDYTKAVGCSIKTKK